MKKILQYTISLIIAGALFWYVYKEHDISELLSVFKQANPVWILISVAVSLVSHYSRGLRWGLALKPLGYNTSNFRIFMATLSAYFANAVVPRMGEVVRCSVLYKTERVPVKVSFGAVITERALDMIVFLALASTMFLMEFDKVSGFVFKLIDDGSDQMVNKFIILGVLGISGLAVLALMVIFRNRLRQLPLYHKVVDFISGFADGLTSIRKMSTKDQFLYVVHTANIWFMYYLMSYLLFFASDTTADLGMRCAFAAMMMGGLGMIIPTPGGAGSYHLLVTQTLIAYGLTEMEAGAFAFLMHGSQTLSIVFFGGLSLIISNQIGRKKSKEAPQPTDDKSIPLQESSNNR
ncbi:lysylphosphatidylglycerol synthase transmembrane domain-containing protein [Limibacter armeniacum]|uniref:lysylphosphatidylglycerol synthase transmembrane domain-containing protein n=1 Tax=Limibacter armeniacum TaxID=466084 RepID=UPI002FE529A7